MIFEGFLDGLKNKRKKPVQVICRRTGVPTDMPILGKRMKEIGGGACTFCFFS
jgi:hypothetical protein